MCVLNDLGYLPVILMYFGVQTSKDGRRHLSLVLAVICYKGGVDLCTTGGCGSRGQGKGSAEAPNN